jgi:protein gp37
MSKIEWTDETWNPIVGCSLVSPGCTNCYAMRVAARNAAMNPGLERYQGLTKPSKAGPVWTGKIGIAPDEVLTKPLRWKRRRMIFVNSMSDLFHESVPDEWIDRIFAVMAMAPQHTFQILTKRSRRMREYCSAPGVADRVWKLTGIVAEHGKLRALALHGAAWGGDLPWPLGNVWKGVSVEDQTRADERIPDLLVTPAAVRWISAEPLLGPVDLSCVPANCPDLDGKLSADWFNALTGQSCGTNAERPEPDWPVDMPRLDWVVAGGESGPGARPMHPAWARSLRDQCAEACVPFFFKQWGEWVDWRQFGATSWRNTTPQRASYNGPCRGTFHGGEQHFSGPFETRHDRAHIFARKGKARAGRLLDGVEHNAMPEGGR